ncbi:MAG: HAD-IA family hydrolase [Sumerlaeia bacterium]
MVIDEDAIEWVLCDLGKVLVNFDHVHVAHNLETFLEKNPGRLRPGQQVPELPLLAGYFFAEPYRDATRNVLMDRGALDLVDIARDLDVRYGVNISADELRPVWSDIFTTVNHHVVEAMKRARERGKFVAICSSTNQPHWEHILETYPEIADRWWDRAFLSFELGHSKNDEGFFHAIIEATGCAPRSHYFIDDMQKNVDAALAAGMQAEVFTGELPELGMFA